MHFRNIFQSFLLVISVFFLGSCGYFENTHIHQNVRQIVRPHIQTDEYIEHVSLADLLVNYQAGNTASLASHLSAIEIYTAQKKKNTLAQQIVLLTFMLKDKKDMQYAIAPFSLDASADNNALIGIMDMLESIGGTLQDVRMAILPVIAEQPIKFKDKNADQIKIILDQKIQSWRQKLQPLPPLADAEAQIALIRFFINHRARDAAYLSVENAKESLAVASVSSADVQKIKDLSGQLAAQENQLHKVMPFTLGLF